MTASIFICYSSRDKERRQQLQDHLAGYRRVDITTFVDVEIPEGSDWRSVIDDRLQDASAAVIFVSHHLLASDFVLDSELPIFMRRWQNKDIDLRVVSVSAHHAEQHVLGHDEHGRPLTLMSVQQQRHDSRPSVPLDAMSSQVQTAYLADVALDICKFALARDRRNALKDWTREQLLVAWASSPGIPPGLPLPEDLPADPRLMLRAMLDKLMDTPGPQLEYLRKFGTTSPADKETTLSGPDVQVVIRELADDPQHRYQVDFYGPSPRPPPVLLEEAALPSCLLEAANFVGRRAKDVYIEAVVKLSGREMPVDTWLVREGSGDLAIETPAGRLGKLTLRSLERAESEALRRALRERAATPAERQEGYGAGGASCRYAKLRIDSADSAVMLTGSVQCAVIDHVPASGRERLAMLRAPIVRGVGTLLWCRQTGRGEELAALAAPHAPAALPGFVLDTRQNSDLGQHLTLVVDDADFTLDIPPLTSPTEVT